MRQAKIPGVTPLRIGAPPDVDAAVLVHQLPVDGPGTRAELTLATYRQLGSLLDTGALDLALLSASEVARRSESFELVPGLSISTRGGTSLARLAFQPPLQSVRRVTGRSTGHAAELLVPLLFQAAGSQVSFELVHGSPLTPLARGEARLLTGLDAFDAERLGATIDLSESWTSLTGLPFLWAAWVARPGLINASDYGLLHALRSRGRHDLASISFGAAGGDAKRSGAICLVLEQIRYRFGRAELAGARRFWDEAHRLSLLPRRVEPRFLRLARGTPCRTVRGERR